MGPKLMTDLFTIGYSPWSEKARWALDHHRIDYRERNRYLPGFTVPWLRIRFALPAALTLPLLIAKSERIFDSKRIAQWADACGQGSRLFPPENLGDIEQWNSRCEEVLDSGRALFLQRLVDDAEARALMLPRWAANSTLLHQYARRRSRSLLNKYGGALRTPDAHRSRMRGTFEHVRAALADGRRYLLGPFTFADIAAATSMHYLTPVVHSRVPVERRAHQLWSINELAAEFPDLLHYRDALYQSERQAK